MTNLMMTISILFIIISVSYCMKPIGNQKTVTSQSYNEITYMDRTNEYDLIQFQPNLLITNEKINNMLILQNEFLKPLRSPGETSYLPISINAKGRLEIAVNVISTAIFILTLSIKMQEALNWDKETKYSIYDLSSNNINKYSKNIEKLDNGIKYMNEKRDSYDTKLQPGDKLQVNIKLYYNGLELSYLNTNSNSIYEIEEILFGSGDIVDKININVPFVCLKDIVKNVAIGSITKVSIPPELAFGTVGFPPFVPADATILCEILLQKVK